MTRPTTTRPRRQPAPPTPKPPWPPAIFTFDVDPEAKQIDWAAIARPP